MTMMKTADDGPLLYEVTPLAYADGRPPSGALYILNATSMCCTCPVFAAHGFCSHLLTVPGGEAALAAYDEDAVFPMHKRRQIRPQGVDFEEPTEDCMEKVQALRLVGEQRKRPSVRGEFTSLSDRLRDAVKQLSPEKQMLALIKLEVLVKEAETEVPAFTSTWKTQQKVQNRSASRQEGDRKHKALHPRRGKAAEAEAKLPAAQDFQRTSKAREKRKRGPSQR